MNSPGRPPLASNPTNGNGRRAFAIVDATDLNRYGILRVIARLRDWIGLPKGGKVLVEAGQENGSNILKVRRLP